MTNIIIGAGLGGLYTALRLLNKAVRPANIVIIDPRAGRYTRPGHLNCETFDLVKKKTGISTGHSSAHHIKELERAMYNELHAKGVQFVKEQFVTLQQKIDNPVRTVVLDQMESQVKAVITQKENGSKGVYPGDYVFDCSGIDAAVAMAANRHLKNIGAEPIFQSTPLVDINPITDHLIAQVIIFNANNLTHFMTYSDNADPVPPRFKDASPQKNIEMRNKLRSLGWSYEAFPTFYTYPQARTHKICLYMETPVDLPKEQQQAWIKLLLTIYSNGAVTDYQELKPSRTYGEKPRIMGFKSIPHRLNKVIVQADNLPMVITGFDALKGFDYRLADGVGSGIECCELMLSNITVSDGRIQNIDTSAIERDVFAYINIKHKERLTEQLKSRQTSIEKGQDYFSEIYLKAAEQLLPSEHIKKQHYQSIAGEIAHQGALAQYSTLSSRDKSAVPSIEVLNRCFGLLIRARQYISANEAKALDDIKTKLQSVFTILNSEMMVFDIEEMIGSSGLNSSQATTLFKSIKQNLAQLDGSFDTAAIQSKLNNIMKGIKRLPEPSLNLASFIGPDGASDELVSLLLLGVLGSSRPSPFALLELGRTGSLSFATNPAAFFGGSSIVQSDGSRVSPIPPFIMRFK
jgi:hypothetical protein